MKFSLSCQYVKHSSFIWSFSYVLSHPFIPNLCLNYLHIFAYIYPFIYRFPFLFFITIFCFFCCCFSMRNSHKALPWDCKFVTCYEQIEANVNNFSSLLQNHWCSMNSYFFDYIYAKSNGVCCVCVCVCAFVENSQIPISRKIDLKFVSLHEYSFQSD